MEMGCVPVCMCPSILLLLTSTWPPISLLGEGGNTSTRAVSLVSRFSHCCIFPTSALQLCTCCLPLGATPPLLILLPGCWPHHVAKAASLEASLFPNTDFFFFPLGLIPLLSLLPGRWVAVCLCPVCSLLCCPFSPGFVLLSPSFLPKKSQGSSPSEWTGCKQLLHEKRQGRTGNAQVMPPAGVRRRDVSLHGHAGRDGRL